MPETDEYRKAHASGEVTGKYKAFRRVIKKEFGLVCGYILSHHTKKNLRILDIGGGDGRSFIQIAQTIMPIGKNFSLDYIEVSPKQAQAFITNMNNASLADKVESIHLTSWEEFTPVKKYDVVLALHSWYGIRTDSGQFRKLVDCLDNKGTGYIVVARERSLWHELGRGLGKERITGNDIKEILKKEKIPHSIETIYDNQFDISDLFTGRKLTKAGKAAVSYMLRQDYRKLSKEQKKHINVIFGQQQSWDYAASDLIIIPGEQK